MHEFGIRYLECIKCHGRLEAVSLREKSEIEEGFLSCTKCSASFPIIGAIAILQDFTRYLSFRPRLGGVLIATAKSPQMKLFVKKALARTKRNLNDVSIIEKRWAAIYEANKRSSFYSKIKAAIDDLHPSGIAVEHGCSIGTVSHHMAKKGLDVFGIDKSYHALSLAKKSCPDNLDFFVADSLDNPFGRRRFDIVVGLNIFELIEPRPLLDMLANQVQKGGYLVLSDPYDFERGARSVREPLREDAVRVILEKRGLDIAKKTEKPSFLSWSLRLYDRAVLQYRVDLIIGKKRLSRKNQL